MSWLTVLLCQTLRPAVAVHMNGAPIKAPIKKERKVALPLLFSVFLFG